MPVVQMHVPSRTWVEGRASTGGSTPSQASGGDKHCSLHPTQVIPAAEIRELEDRSGAGLPIHVQTCLGVYT